MFLPLLCVGVLAPCEVFKICLRCHSWFFPPRLHAELVWVSSLQFSSRSGGLIHTVQQHPHPHPPPTYFLICPSHCCDYDLCLSEQHTHLGAAACGRNLKTVFVTRSSVTERRPGGPVCYRGDSAHHQPGGSTGCVSQERAAEIEGWLLLCDVNHGKVHSASLTKNFASGYGCFVNPSGLFPSTGPHSTLAAMATAAWYHRDISRVQAEELLARAGKDGSYLVRDSESVPGAYALCLLWVYEDLTQHRPTEIHICGTATWCKWLLLCIYLWFVTLQCHKHLMWRVATLFAHFILKVSTFSEGWTEQQFHIGKNGDMKLKQWWLWLDWF